MQKALVIGGGIAGASIARCLAARGVGVQLLEKSGQLCSGSTWHAAGLVTRFAGSPKLKKLHARSLQLLTALHDEHDIHLHTAGSIRIIEKGHKDRLMEAKHHVEMARLYDIPDFPTTLIDPAEVKHLHPLVDESRIECGIRTLKDGDVDPSLLTNCVANLARNDGAQILLRHEVVSVDRLPGNKFRVTVLNHATKQTEHFETDILINAAGLWSKHVTQLVDKQQLMTHPAFIIEHQYAITEEVPEVLAITKQGLRLPVLRDLRASSYIRQERTSLLIGPYEKDCRVRNLADSRGDWKMQPPADWGMELFPDHVARLEENLIAAMELIPPLANVGIKVCVNGPTIWTGDSLARCGRTLIPNYYDFNTLTYGIAQSLPLAEYLCHIILEGEQPWDATSDFDPLRYGKWASEEYTFDKVRDTYSKNNVVSYGSFENREAARQHIPQYPLHEVLKKHNAVCVFSTGMEVPAYFTATPPVTQGRYTHHEWHPTVMAEAQNVATNVGISYASFSKLRVRGAGARAFLNKATTNLIPAEPGKCRLTYAVTPKGRVVAEFTITGEFTTDGVESFYVVGSRDYAEHDMAWLNQQLRAWGHNECGESITVTNITDDVDILHVAGPNSRSLLTAIHPDFANLPFMTMKKLKLGQFETTVFRVSFTGCQGFEIHTSRANGVGVHDLIWSHAASKQAGLKHFGSYAQNSLRVEKGFKIKADLDYSHYTEAGIEPFVSKKKSIAFVGHNPDHVVTKNAAIFEVATAPGFEWSVPSDLPIVNAQNQILGYTTSCAYGAITRKTYALGYTWAGAELSGPLTVRCYGETFAVRHLSSPPLPCDRT